MTDVFMIHRAAATTEAHLRFQALKARNELGVLQVQYDELMATHNELVNCCIADRKAYQVDQNELAEARQRADQAETILEKITEQIHPLLVGSMAATDRLCELMNQWGQKDGKPSFIPVEPGMKETIESLNDLLHERVKVVSIESESDAEQIMSAIAKAISD